MGMIGAWRAQGWERALLSRGHMLLYILAYYVEWHMREAWRELMFADEDELPKQTRDPVAGADQAVDSRGT